MRLRPGVLRDAHDTGRGKRGATQSPRKYPRLDRWWAGQAWPCYIPIHGYGDGRPSMMHLVERDAEIVALPAISPLLPNRPSSRCSGTPQEMGWRIGASSAMEDKSWK